MITIDCPWCDGQALVDGAVTALDCAGCGHRRDRPGPTPALALAA